jgi:HEAT repeat protein
MLLADGDSKPTPAPDLAQLQEMLHDRQHPREQSQAALVLLEIKGKAATAVVREGLRQAEDTEVFLALAAAVRVYRDNRFREELFAALVGNRPTVRQAAAEALAVLADAPLVRQLQEQAADSKADLAVRLAAVWTLGHCGRKQAVEALIAQVDGDNEPLRRAAADALADLSGQNFGADAAPWRTWWERHKNLSEADWLQTRLLYQASRGHRLEADLRRARTQVLRLQQQLYSRLTLAERLNHLQAVVEQDDPAVRALAVSWCLELLPAADASRQRLLTQVLVRLSHDGVLEVQQAAVFALGRVHDAAALERLQALLTHGQACVRAAAVRSLALQARSNGPDALASQRQVVPALQKALDDPALEVVVETAEALGALGAPEAGGVLTNLLRHRSEQVRQAAAQALERVADASVLDGLLKALDDPNVTVRFSLLGALARAVGDGRCLAEERRNHLLERLEELLQRDPDPGVRSRAATVLGECAPPALLPALWRCVQASEDSRVQEKAWAAMIEIVARSANLSLLQEWDRTLTTAKQGARRLQLLTEVVARWQKGEETKTVASAAQETLIQAELEMGKWAAAFPLVRELLARPGSEADLQQRLSWLLTVGEQALKEGNRAEAQRAVREAQPYLPRSGDLTQAFEKLDKQAGPKE